MRVVWCDNNPKSSKWFRFFFVSSNNTADNDAMSLTYLEGNQLSSWFMWPTQHAFLRAHNTIFDIADLRLKISSASQSWLSMHHENWLRSNYHFKSEQIHILRELRKWREKLSSLTICHVDIYLINIHKLSERRRVFRIWIKWKKEWIQRRRRTSRIINKQLCQVIRAICELFIHRWANKRIPISQLWSNKVCRDDDEHVNK